LEIETGIEITITYGKDPRNCGFRHYLYQSVSVTVINLHAPINSVRSAVVSDFSPKIYGHRLNGVK